MADAHALGACGETRGGSSPLPPITATTSQYLHRSYPERPSPFCKPRGNGYQMWHVYLLKCRDGSFYTGITSDIQERLLRHNEGTGAEYTRLRRPVELIYSERYATKDEARRREIVIKKFGVANKRRLIQWGLGEKYFWAQEE